jgi:hypothetical protein
MTHHCSLLQAVILREFKLLYFNYMIHITLCELRILKSWLSAKLVVELESLDLVCEDR